MPFFMRAAHKQQSCVVCAPSYYKQNARWWNTSQLYLHIHFIIGLKASHTHKKKTQKIYVHVKFTAFEITMDMFDAANIGMAGRGRWKHTQKTHILAPRLFEFEYFFFFCRSGCRPSIHRVHRFILNNLNAKFLIYIHCVLCVSVWDHISWNWFVATCRNYVVSEKFLKWNCNIFYYAMNMCVPRACLHCTITFLCNWMGFICTLEIGADLAHCIPDNKPIIPVCLFIYIIFCWYSAFAIFDEHQFTCACHGIPSVFLYNRAAALLSIRWIIQELDYED